MGHKNTGCLNPWVITWLKSAGILEISLLCQISQTSAVIEVLADDRRREFMLYNMFARMTAGRLLGLNSGDWSIMLGGFALIGMVILLL
jgi:hypothetical protein